MPDGNALVVVFSPVAFISMGLSIFLLRREGLPFVRFNKQIKTNLNTLPLPLSSRGHIVCVDRNASNEAFASKTLNFPFFFNYIFMHPTPFYFVENTFPTMSKLMRYPHLVNDE